MDSGFHYYGGTKKPRQDLKNLLFRTKFKRSKIKYVKLILFYFFENPILNVIFGDTYFL